LFVLGGDAAVGHYLSRGSIRVSRALRLASAAATLCVASLLPLCAAPLSAQSREKAPKRPQLPAGRDTNSGFAYYLYGKSELAKNPSRAADAFYWASRLQPGIAELLYSRRIALLRSDRRRLVRYFFGELERDREIQRIDSLQYWALLRNPFLDQQLDGTLIDDFFFELTGEATPIQPMSDPRMAAWMAQRNGNLALASAKYAQAIAKYPKQPSLRGERARVLYLLGQFDSVVVELTRMRDALAAEDAKKLVRVYDSRAMVEYRLGRTHARMGNLPAAREAYGRALAEDLAFYMGHVALADLAMAQGDTATALSELDLAVQLKEDDGELRHRYGTLLAVSGKMAEAVPHFRKAIELEPYYAPSHLYLARVLEAQMNVEAIEFYKSYIARAEQSDPQLAAARTQLADLEAWAAAVKNSSSGAGATGAAPPAKP
jgi:Tfp pilus assembly protein PilF